MPALVAGIHVFVPGKDVDGRANGVPAARAQRGSRPGHDERAEWISQI
jgi:hypothetical protein